MKPTRKLFLLISILQLVLFVSCKEKEIKYTIGVSQCSSDEWRDKMNMEMQNEAALSQDIDLIILSSNDDTEKQIADIRYLINKKIDLLILTPNEINPITPLIEEIYNSGIPIILVDRRIQSQKYTAFIGADNYQIGKEVGAYAANILQGKGNIVEIKGLSNSSPAIERHQGFCDVIRNYPDLKIVFEAEAGWLKEEGKIQMQEALHRIKKIDLVFAQNDRMAKGAHLAAEKEGISEDIVFLGIDALPGEGEGIDMVLENKLEATFLYPTGGDKTIQLATNILKKKKFEKENILATSVINKSNAKILKLQIDQITEQQNKIGVLNQRVNQQLTKYIVQRNIIYAISILVFLFLALLIVLFRAYDSKNKLNVKLHFSNQEINKQKDELEKKQTQLISLSKQLEEATLAKLSFFTDISHDFRTPLTLIAGPVDMLLSLAETNTPHFQWLKIIKKNTAILLRLVDQIIEFRKIETNSIQMNLSSNDLDGNISDWNISFTEIALKKNLAFCYQKTTDLDFICLVDIDKIERIYYNLLSNAFKFTPVNGIIRVELSKIVERENEFIQLTVANTGHNLSEKEIERIFNRFYRIDPHLFGSGIGLALVKALVELHQGTINATSTNGLTVFTLKIPFLFSTKQPNTISETYESTNFSFSEVESIDIKEYNDEEMALKKHPFTVLIIDDNEEIRLYIRSILKRNYHIIEAKDGEEGLTLTYENKIDIIVSDIMMPKIDGVAFCRKIKEDKRICHIPVILLTAYAIDEQRVKGFESGADAYISKPFNSQILEIRIRKMIENRQKLYTYLGHNMLIEDASIPELNTLDKELIIKFRKRVLERISDTDLNVEEISREFGFSRAQFYRKIKAITNQGPNEFIRTVRLNKSVEMLKIGKTVSEVAYEVGFTSPSYFTKCFKEYFKHNPSQMI